jgi:hypothetical protein
MGVTVQKSGVWAEWTQELPSDLVGQLRLTNGLWNDLVRSHEEHEGEIAAIWSSYPEVAAVEGLIAQAEERNAKLAEDVRTAKLERHVPKLNAKDPLRVALAENKKVLIALRQQRRDAIQAVNEDAKARLGEALNRRYGREKALYAVFTSAGGFWASYNDVTRRRFGVALGRVKALRRAGRPAELRGRRFDGTGTITVQLQKGTSDVQRTPEVIADAENSRWRNVLCVPLIDRDAWEGMTRAERKRAGRQIVRMRCGQDGAGNPAYLEVPVQIHRQLPPEAEISEARLTVRRVGPDLRAALTVVATVPDAEPRTSGPMVILHLGWADHPDGIQIASWSSTSKLTIPEAWRHVMRADTSHGTGGIVVVPERVDQRLANIDKQRGHRDDRLNEVKAELVKWVEANGPIPSPYLNDDGSLADPLTAGQIKAWRSPARFVVLGRYLSSGSWAETEPAAMLHTWAGEDLRRWRSQEHGRARVLAHRDDTLKNIAAIIARQAVCLVVDDMSIADLARKVEPTGDEVIPPQALEGVARRRVIGAPGRFREFTVMACKRDGVHLVTVPSKHLSLEHAACGHVNEPESLDPARMRPCAGCGRRYSPDRSALVLMQNRALTILAEEGASFAITR